MKKLNSWFEIDSKEYMTYILLGYEIEADEDLVTWFLNGQIHREDGPAIIEADGSESWFLNNQRHREDGPAYIGADGTQVWYLNGKRHREDGPAIIWADGTKQWWLNSRYYTEHKFNEKIKLLV